MPANMFPHKFFKAAGMFLALLFYAASPAFPLGLESAGSITPTGMDTGFLNPAALWYDNMRGFLVVANTHARQVAVINRQGQALKVLGKKEELGFPVAIAGSSEGTLYVAEKGSELLKIFPRYDAVAGDGFRTFDLSPYRQKAPVRIAALYMDGDGKLYVADRGNRQLLVFGSDDKLRFAIPGVGDPADIWVDHSGKILVADPGFGGIRVYSPQGSWLRTLGEYSEQFREPLRVKGLAVDRQGRIWIIEEGDRRIKALDSLGNLLLTFGGNLSSPADLTVDAEGNLYVLEQGANRISVFRITGF